MRATGSSGRAAQRGPRGQNRRTGPCGMRRGGQRRHGRQRSTSDDRGQYTKAGTAHARRRPGSRAAKRRRGTPNGPAGLRSGQRQRRAGNQILCPVDFIAFNETLHGRFCLVYLLKLWRMRFPTGLRVKNWQTVGQKYLSLPNVKAKIDCRHAFNAINATQAPHPGAHPLAGTGGGVFRAAWGREETAGPWQSRRWQLR